MQAILDRLRGEPAIDLRALPIDAARATPGLPVIVFAHGGGWTFGSIDTHGGTMQSLAAHAGAAVLGIDYRLAPEHPFPAPLDDVCAALDFVQSGGHACVAVLAWLLPPLLNRAFVSATWSGNAEACRAAGGACWAFIREKFWFSVFGLYPFELRWRPAIVLGLFAVMVAISTQSRLWSGKLIYGWIAALAVMWTLMGAGVPVLSSLPVVGHAFVLLEPVPTRLWGGWLVTIFLAVFGLAIAYPIGIVLALGRRSPRPFLRLCCVVWKGGSARVSSADRVPVWLTADPDAANGGGRR
jgi:hypothetical protein